MHYPIFLTRILLLLIFGILPLSPAFPVEQIQFRASVDYGDNPVILRGELHKPSGDGNYPLVIMLHGCGGLRNSVKSSFLEHINALQENGFSTLILDSYGPRGIAGGWVCQRISRLASARAFRGRDTLDAIKFLKTRDDIDIQNIFVMGRSNGGSVVSMLASNKRVEGIRAAVAYYPWCGVVPEKPAIPLLVLSGAKDDWTPPDYCKDIHNPENGLTVIVYPEAVHSFDLDIPVQTYKGHKVGGNPAATSDSRKRMINFFKKHLVQ